MSAPTEADILQHLLGRTRGPRYDGGFSWVRHTFYLSGSESLLDALRVKGFIESYGRGRNRHHALTKAGMAAAALLKA